ncbi:MAG: hypothetical protein ACRDGE_06680 [Candidatus Limnocylindria bacterium]
MTETAEFPLPADVTDEERATLRREIGRYTRILAEEPGAIRFEGRWLGQTGPVWHVQYARIYALPEGYLLAAHDLREGMKVGFAREPERLLDAVEHPAVREFLEDELRFRKVIGDGHGPERS